MHTRASKRRRSDDTGWILLIHTGSDDMWQTDMYRVHKHAIVFDNIEEAKRRGIQLAMDALTTANPKETAKKVDALCDQGKLDEALAYIEEIGTEEKTRCEFVPLAKSQANASSSKKIKLEEKQVNNKREKLVNAGEICCLCYRNLPEDWDNDGPTQCVECQEKERNKYLAILQSPSGLAALQSLSTGSTVF